MAFVQFLYRLLNIPYSREYKIFSIQLTEYKILSTGVDLGHRYIVTDVTYNGIPKRIAVFFEERSDEKLLAPGKIINIIGTLTDDGTQNSLLISDAKIVKE